MSDYGTDKEQDEPDCGGRPMSGTPMPTSSPSAPAALRMPNMVIHDSGTPALAMAMLTCLQRTKSHMAEKMLAAGGQNRDK